MIKLLIGGSPCTYWSIAQKKQPGKDGKRYRVGVIQKLSDSERKIQTDFFLYENNKSAAQPIKDQIKKELNVYDGTFFMEDSGSRYIEINSALVSAQNRQRFYVHNCSDVGQPEDRNIMLSDILESGVTDKDKAYCLKHQAGNARDYFKKHHTQVVYEPVIIQNAHGFNKGGIVFADENLNQLKPQLFRDMSCLTDEQTADYLGDKDGYGWHISDLKIYDKPRKLSEFYTIPKSGSDCCFGCLWNATPLDEMPCRTCKRERKYLYRPPQSYMFVEELGE